MRDFRDAKLMAKALREQMAARNISITHSEALETVARQFGFNEWNILAAKLNDAERTEHSVAIDPAVPIFRIFAVDKAMEFYCGFLGFKVDWEHRFGENFPLYCQVSRSGMVMHLSEHACDASPGARVFVPMKGIRALHKELNDKNYRYMKPGLEEAPWGLELAVTDPFSNRITFCERN